MFQIGRIGECSKRIGSFASMERKTTWKTAWFLGFDCCCPLTGVRSVIKLNAWTVITTIWFKISAFSWIWFKIKFLLQLTVLKIVNHLLNSAAATLTACQIESLLPLLVRSSLCFHCLSDWVYASPACQILSLINIVSPLMLDTTVERWSILAYECPEVNSFASGTSTFCRTRLCRFKESSW